MSFTDDSDSEWRDSKIKTETHIARAHISPHRGKQKYPQKFCDKWLTLFSPWLQKCDDDPNKPFCIACQCRLDCNRCHLHRHERTTKHARNLEILLSKGEGAARQSLSIRQERSKYYQQRKHITSSAVVSSQEDSMGLDTTDDFIEESGTVSYQFAPSENPPDTEETVLKQDTPSNLVGASPKHKTFLKHSIVKTNLSNRVTKRPVVSKERMKLLMQIQKDKSELMDSFKELMGTRPSMYQSTKKRNHVDLFFESVSSTVKALSPKLVAEAKMRVSQLICELELRALTEGESSPNGGSLVGRTEPVVFPSEASNTYMINQEDHCHDKDEEHYT